MYGYARARRVIWAGFAAMVFASVMAAVIVALPPAPGWTNQPAYEIAFGSTWRIVGASLCAFFCGEFVNSCARPHESEEQRTPPVVRDDRLDHRRRCCGLDAFYPNALEHFQPASSTVRRRGSCSPSSYPRSPSRCCSPRSPTRSVAFLGDAEHEDHYDREHRFHAVLDPPLARFRSAAFH